MDPASIAKEAWNQIRRHHDRTRHPVPEAYFDWHLDPGIAPGLLGEAARNREPLLINRAGSWARRPEPVTAVPNLFLCGDYVRTSTDLACMEGANEAARRAVNGVLRALHLRAPACKLWSPREPAAARSAQALDTVRWRMGKPHMLMRADPA
jgi:uncharacterized protein with NAD-binding domain and iron-sulfur cluster